VNSELWSLQTVFCKVSEVVCIKCCIIVVINICKGFRVISVVSSGRQNNFLLFAVE